MKRLFLSLALLTGCLSSAFAHTVWIEPLQDQLVIRFAEPGDDFETSPGFLDSLTAPQTFYLFTNSPVSVDAPKKADHFLIPNVTATNTAYVESAFTVRGGRKPNFYARWQPDLREGKPLLTFDLVPTGKPGEVRVYFRGKPLGGAKATLRTPDKKDHELTADAEGFVRFETKGAGQYLLTVPHHREDLAGFHLGRPFEQTSHNTALTWRQP